MHIATELYEVEILLPKHLKHFLYVIFFCNECVQQIAKAEFG